MARASQSVDPFAALREPLFWGALVALVLNDHVLKGADVLPGAVTGKLSDFAGLVVAPVVLAGLLRVRTHRGALAAVFVVGAVFSAINVSSSAAGWMEAAMSWMRWRCWTDPSDLVALPALGAAWWLLRESGGAAARSAEEPRDGASAEHALQR